MSEIQEGTVSKDVGKYLNTIQQHQNNKTKECQICFETHLNQGTFIAYRLEKG